MGPSSAPTYSKPLVPQSQAEASLPAEVTVVTVENAEKGEGTDRVVADYALAEMGDPSEILCDMYGMYIRREKLSCLNASGGLIQW
ncbi:hypothetical protein VitviT2T_008164 [Vitis vinifera]|uniref:Uncharacterized protein n=1 Tax=Vitis vinifera TaxID=29760 RepID=A0ABY9C0Z9_VITVI|nr:hypothetical protein VitviT2T_008164 [Vitis vinifera]